MTLDTPAFLVKPQHVTKFLTELISEHFFVFGNVLRKYSFPFIITSILNSWEFLLIRPCRGGDYRWLLQDSALFFVFLLLRVLRCNIKPYSADPVIKRPDYVAVLKMSSLLDFYLDALHISVSLAAVMRV